MEESEYVALKFLVTHYLAFRDWSPKGMATCSTATHRSGSFGENSVVESEENWEAKPFASSELMEKLELRRKCAPVLKRFWMGLRRDNVKNYSQ